MNAITVNSRKHSTPIHNTKKNTKKRKLSVMLKSKLGYSMYRIYLGILLVALILGATYVGLRRSSAVAETPPRGTNFKVFIVAGQSNAIGNGADASRMGTSTHDKKIKFYYTHDNTTSTGITYLKAQDGLFMTRDGNLAIQGIFGPEIGLGRNLYSKGLRNIYIIKVAQGGTSMYQHWNSTNGTLYDKYINQEINKGLQKLRNQGYTYTVKGFFWMQGESDMTALYAPNYENNLRNFITAIRNKFSNQNLPFIIGRANYPKAPVIPRDVVRNAQVKVSDTVTNVDWVNTDDFTLYDSIVHYDASGELLLGKRFYNKILPYLPSLQ